MRLRTLEIVNFRNHTHTVVRCGQEVNGLIGENGQGKTNVLEAISYVCLTKSFCGTADSVAVQVGQNQFAVSGELVGDSGVRYSVGVTYDSEIREKRYAINGSAIERFADVVGEFPVVVLSAESGSITLGGPVDRRKFMDFVIAQSSRSYLEDLLEYRRVLRQRNKVLMDAKLTRRDYADLLAIWSGELIARGVRIMMKRRIFVNELQALVQDSYRKLAGDRETPGIRYRPSVEADEQENEEAVRLRFGEELERKKEEEQRSAATVLGPHRDELEMLINGLNARKYASQGQHKTLLIALKIAEFAYLRERRNEKPILLLDDIFGELDTHRSEHLLDLISPLGQAFLTATSEKVLPPDINWGKANRKFLVRDGAVTYNETESYNW